MTTDQKAKASARKASDAARDPDRMGLVALIALAAGGMIGSGWMLGAYHATQTAGQWAWVSWLLGGVLMTAIGVVMVELGRHRAENGGLVFWPLKSSGPLMTIAVAAALWVFYALNPATEAAAVVQAMGNKSLYDYDPVHPGPTTAGLFLSGVLMIPIVGVTLLGFRVIRTSTVWLTAFKVFVPVSVIVLLFASGFDAHGVAQHSVAQGHSVIRAIVSALTSGGVIYAYIGFQGPLDFAGEVKDDGRFSEAARLKIAVIGTLVATTLLYTLLQVVYLGHTGRSFVNLESPYTKFAAGIAITGTAVAILVRIDSIVSPAGAGVLFALLLSEEVEAMSREGLTDTRLATVEPRLWPRGPRRHWPILALNLGIGWLELAFFGGDWVTMVTASSILTLFVYAMPAASLLAFAKFHRDYPDPEKPGYFRVGWGTQSAAWFGFVGVTEVLFWAGWTVMWRAALLLTAATLLLLVLPRLSRYIERFQLYEADNPWTQKSARPGLLVLALYLASILLLSRLGMSSSHHPVVSAQVGSILAALVGITALALLRHYSARYQEREILPSGRKVPLQPGKNLAG
ncbi:amino acid transporter [Catenulispora sp. EB89]|uniref:APC family permease n=1 Tax=Catenulispora sp. EB89 TaxID=3156257 RepID=UPI0035130A76